MKWKGKRFLSWLLVLVLIFPLAATRAYAGLGVPGPDSSPPPPVERYTLYDDMGSAFSDYLAQKAGGGSLSSLETWFNRLTTEGRGFSVGGRELNTGRLGGLFGKLGKAFDIGGVVKDVASYTDSSNHKHASLEFLDNVFRGWAIGLSTIGKEVPYAGDIAGMVR